MKPIDRQGWKGNRDAAKFVNAKGLANALAGMLDRMPTNFRRGDVVTKLGIKTQREINLLTDALYLLKNKRLISWNAAANAWKNASRAG